MKYESFITRDLQKVLSQKFNGVFDYDQFASSQLGVQLLKIWEENALKSCQLTTVGQMIGVMVGDQYVGGKTDMSGWGA